MSLRARTDALIVAVDIPRTNTIKSDVRALAAALGVPFNGVATTLAALEAECLAAPAPAPVPAESGRPSVSVVADIIARARADLPDSLTAMQRTQVTACIANALARNVAVSTETILADDAPAHALLRWEALKNISQYLVRQQGVIISEAMKSAATACTAAASNGDADAALCVRELAIIGGPIVAWVVHQSFVAAHEGEEGALAVIADATDANNEMALLSALSACAALLKPGGGEVADRRKAMLRVVPALAARAPLPDATSSVQWRAVADACTRHALAAVGAPERGVAPADALQCWAAAFDHFRLSGAEPPWAALERALVDHADEAPVLRRRALAVLELIVDDWDKESDNAHGGSSNWRQWLCAASTAEYESGHHLVAAAADAFLGITADEPLIDNWTADVEQALVDGYQLYGDKRAKIKREFSVFKKNGRTDQDIREKFRTLGLRMKDPTFASGLKGPHPWRSRPLEAKWVRALAGQLLRHRNPSARKALLQRLLDHADPAKIADWPLLRDAILPALDDTELRKGRDVARRCDAAAVEFVALFYRAAPEETRADVVAYALRGGGRPRARAALLGLFEDFEFAALPGPNIQDDDVAAAAAALEAADNDAATHALALAVVPLVCCQDAAASPATAGAFVAACSHAIIDEAALDMRLATWLKSRVSDAGAIDDARATAAVAALTTRLADVDSAFKRHGLKGLKWLVIYARGSRRRSEGVWDAVVATDASKEWFKAIGEDVAKATESSDEEGAALIEDAVAVWAGVPALWCGGDPPQSNIWRAGTATVIANLAEAMVTGRYSYMLALVRAGIGCQSREQLKEIGVPKLLIAATAVVANATGTRAQAVARTEGWRMTATLLDAGALAAADVDQEKVLGALEGCDASVNGVTAVLRVAMAVISAAPPDAAAIAANRATSAFLDCAKLGSPELGACVAFRVVAPLIKRALNDPDARSLGQAAADVCARLLAKTSNPVARRSALARALAFALCAGARGAACDDAQAAVFGPLTAALCLDRDDEVADAPSCVPDDGAVPDPASPERLCFDLCARRHVGPSLARLTTVAFLESDEAPTALRRAAAAALLDLEPALRFESGDASCVRSAAWGRRLKLWQALGLSLVRGDLDEPDSALARRVAEAAALALSSPMAIEVRYACEAASAAACRCWPVVVDALLDRVGAVRDGEVVPLAKGSEIERAGGREIALGSLLAVAGAALIDSADDSIADHKRAKRLLGLACGLVGSPRGLVRGVAVLLSKRLFREFPPIATDVTGRALAHALARDPDVARLVKRQGRFFHDLRSADKCSLKHSANASLVAGLKSDLDLMAIELNRLEVASDLGSYAWKRSKAEVSKKALATVAPTSSTNVAFVQRKVDRVREARLAALQSDDDRTEINGRKRNAVGKETLPLIVCASLVDKAPNLAGLARTCEVFACEQLVVADAAIVARKEFQQIAMTAEKWIPIAAVPPSELRGWLEARRGDGYSVVALEQATGSSCLSASNLSLPTPAVLLLGAEGEGVPNALFDLVDVCVEIPQLGVVRSLNVHVSGAIAVWMFARQMLSATGGDLPSVHEKNQTLIRLVEDQQGVLEKFQKTQAGALDDFMDEILEVSNAVPEAAKGGLADAIEKYKTALFPLGS